jgi:ubiquinone/menaquinone biosynthesis C-methylase UbiE
LPTAGNCGENAATPETDDGMTFQLAGNAPELYERVMVPLWFGRWAEALLDLVAPQPGETVLDVACGTGVTTRMAKRHVGAQGRVDGLDINAPMLARAQELASGQDINWIESDVCDSGLHPATYDAVISQHGYHYFPDKPGALKEFHRLLAPGGRLAFSVWDGHSAYTEALCSAVERHISADIARKQRGQRETPSPDDLVRSVTDAGFTDVTVERQELVIRVPAARDFVPLHLGSMPIAGAFQALADDEKDRLVADVEEALRDHVEGGELIYPDAVNVAISRK